MSLRRLPIHTIASSIGLWTTLVLALLTTGIPLVNLYFPDYLPGYFIQIPAILLLYFYFSHFHLTGLYKLRIERLLLILAFATPLQNTFLVKAYRKALLDQHILLEMFRPDILALIGLAVYVVRGQKTARLPKLLMISLIVGLMGWIASSIFSEHPSISLGNGLFEFLSMWLTLYILLSIAPDRQFVTHATILFCLGAGLAASAQTIAIWTGISSDTIFGFPILADEFLTIKKNLPLMIKAGGNGYGNTDNFASLWILVVPLIAGLSYLTQRFWIAWTSLLLFCYAGLLVYSRSSIGVVVLGLGCLWLHRLIVYRSMSLGLLAIVAGLLLIHLDSEIIRYYSDGIVSLIQSFLPHSTDHGGWPGWVRNQKDTIDASGIARAEAWRRGFEIAAANWKTGIGFGVYPIAEPEYTAPHSMALLRFAEGGILSLLSFLLLCIYAPIRLVELRRSKDILAVASLISISAFLLKAAVFGGSFSINGQIVWGFGVALLLSNSLITGAEDARDPLSGAGEIYSPLRSTIR